MSPSDLANRPQSESRWGGPPSDDRNFKKAKPRLEKTLADYVVTAISPALIMLLVGSLVYFLLAVCYRGQYETRMHWILFWFVFGMVLVERIAIQEGRERALQYGVVLSALVGFAVTRFVDAHVVAWILMAVVWWCSAKLVWDCTLIDDSEDATGEGLLQTAGFNTVGNSGPPEQVNDPADDSISDESKGGKRRPHSPGLWVVYFSMAALPLFGVGQLFIPVQEADRRSYAFQLLAVYVASAIALLLTTSFLGLRRYLRQRRLEMPVAMTGAWLGVGTVLLVAILLLALLIPRPQGEYSVTGLIDKIDAKVREASKFAVLKKDRAEGEGRRIGDQDPNAKQPGEGQPPQQGQPGGQANGNNKKGKPGDSDGQDAGQPGGQSGGDQNGQGANQSDPQANPKSGDPGQRQDPGAQQAQGGQPPQQPGQQQPGQPQGKQAQNGQQPGGEQAAPNTPPAPSSTSLLERLAPLVKWILYGLLALFGLYLLYRHWSQIVDFLARLWATLLGLFGFSWGATPESEGEPESVVAEIRPFASYVNPFTNGAADRMSPPQLVRYTFEALEAWARETGMARPPEQTPLEFADELGRRDPTISNEVDQTTQLYMCIAYSRKMPTRDRLEVLERMWRRFQV